MYLQPEAAEALVVLEGVLAAFAQRYKLPAATLGEILGEGFSATLGEDEKLQALLLYLRRVFYFDAAGGGERS